MAEYKLTEINSNSLRVLGRNDGNIDLLTLFWHGSGIELNVAAKELWVDFYSEYSFMESWIGIWIDGSLINRQVIPKGKSKIPVFLNCDSTVKRHVQIIKETQPMSSDNEGLFQIVGVETDGEFCEVPKPSMNIEFIGDSITSGEGTVGAVSEMSWNPMVMSASFAYPFLTSQALSASCRIVSQGGWGVYSGWDGNKSSNIPSIYDEICSVLKYEKAEKYGALKKNDFAAWKPDVIFVNLGTNDNTSLNEDYSEASVTPVLQAVDTFLIQLRKNNPDSEIIWGYAAFPGPLHEQIGERVRAYALANGDTKIRAYKLPTFTEGMEGSRNHPGRSWHNKVVELLTEELKKK